MPGGRGWWIGSNSPFILSIAPQRADDEHGALPVIRLACMTQADGPVSMVIPPWNGLPGRVLTRVNAGTPSSR